MQAKKSTLVFLSFKFKARGCFRHHKWIIHERPPPIALHAYHCKNYFYQMPRRSARRSGFKLIHLFFHFLIIWHAKAYPPFLAWIMNLMDTVVQPICRTFELYEPLRLFFCLIPPPYTQFRDWGVHPALREPLGFRVKKWYFWSGVAGVRTPDLEHQKKTLYPLRYAPPGSH